MQLARKAVHVLPVTSAVFAFAALATACAAVNSADPLTVRAGFFTAIGFGFVALALDGAAVAVWLASELHHRGR